MLERLRPTREMALRLGLVAIDEMTATLVNAVENPPQTRRIVGVPAMRQKHAAESAHDKVQGKAPAR